MKKIAAVLICVCMLFVSVPSKAAEAFSVSAKAAVLIDADTKTVLYSKNADTRLAMASTTKIMTALLALESDKRDEKFTVDSTAIRVEGSSMGLTSGDVVSLKTLAVGMLMLSGNDAANAAAVYMSGSIEKFARLMNSRAKEIGVKNTNFVTPSGLDSQEHYSTAYDMALIGAEAIKNSDFAEICSKSKYTVCFGSEPQTRTFYNHNRLLKELEGCIGIKTGFTKKAGRCLVSAVKRGGRTLVCVTLKAPNDWQDHKKLYELGFSRYSKYEAQVEPIVINVVNSQTEKIAAEPLFTPELFVREGEKIKNYVAARQFEYAPVYKGQVVGSLVYEADGTEILSVPLVSSQSAYAKQQKFYKEPLTPFEKLLNWIRSLFR